MAKKSREIGAMNFVSSTLNELGYTTSKDALWAATELYQRFVHHLDPETTYLPQNEMLDLLAKVTEYIQNLPLGTNVTVREAIEAVGGDPSLRSTQYSVRQHLFDTKLVTHVPRNGEAFQRIEFKPETPELPH